MEAVPATTSLALKTAVATLANYIGVMNHLELSFMPLGIYGFLKIGKIGRIHRQGLDSVLG